MEKRYLWTRSACDCS